MRKLLIKEIKLCLAPVNLVYLSFSLMTLIPGYPRYVMLYFFAVSIIHLFNNSKLNKDIEYSMILPITKKDIVKSRCLLISSYELLGIILSIPFSLLFFLIMPTPEGNVSGIEGNVAFYGLAFILISLFNLVFIPAYYKKADKTGIPFIKGTIVFWIFYIILEFPIWTKNVFNIEFFKMLDSYDFSSQIKQIPILIFGFLFFVCSWIVTYKISANRFERVDL